MHPPIALTALLLASGLFGLAATPPAVAQAGSASRVPLFSCPTDTAGNVLALTGNVGASGDIGGLLFTAPDGTTWPVEGAPDPSFYMSVSEGAEGYLIEVAFGGPERFFRLFSLRPSGTAGEGQVAPGDGGLIATTTDGTRTRLFTCIEQPVVYQGNLDKATECDASTPLGEAACEVLAPPQRIAPLDLP